MEPIAWEPTEHGARGDRYRVEAAGEGGDGRWLLVTASRVRRTPVIARHATASDARRAADRDRWARVRRTRLTMHLVTGTVCWTLVFGLGGIGSVGEFVALVVAFSIGASAFTGALGIVARSLQAVPNAMLGADPVTRTDRCLDAVARWIVSRPPTFETAPTIRIEVG